MPSTVHNSADLPYMIHQIETYANKHKLDHRFVGGVSYGGLLTEATTYDISIPTRTITLKNHKAFELLRADGSARDIDLITLNTDHEEMTELATFVEALEAEMKERLGYIPPISYEGVFKKNEHPPGLLDFVTTLHREKDDYFLVFDLVQQPISKASLEPWTLQLEDGLTYTTRNPIADYFAYQCRSPAGIKPKDVSKIIYLSQLVKAMCREGKKYRIDYMSHEYYGTWQEFINQLEHSPLPSVQRKRAITRLYWSTMGTAFAHGRGAVGKTALAAFNILNRMYHKIR